MHLNQQSTQQYTSTSTNICECNPEPVLIDSHSHQTWSAMYGLGKNHTLPPRQLYRPTVLHAAKDTPLAPHLEDCWLERENGGWDGMGENGQPPWWEGGAGGTPSPPWVRGCDDTNLPMTRQAQADIWRHQHPATCRNASLKFVVAKWQSGSAYGLGSQLHVITTLFSQAVANDRIFVFTPKSFVRARHAQCKGEGEGLVLTWQWWLRVQVTLVLRISFSMYKRDGRREEREKNRREQERKQQTAKPLPKPSKSPNSDTCH